MSQLAVEKGFSEISDVTKILLETCSFFFWYKRAQMDLIQIENEFLFIEIHYLLTFSEDLI